MVSFVLLWDTDARTCGCPTGAGALPPDQLPVESGWFGVRSRLLGTAMACWLGSSPHSVCVGERRWCGIRVFSMRYVYTRTATVPEAATNLRPHRSAYVHVRCRSIGSPIGSPSDQHSPIKCFPLRVGGEWVRGMSRLSWWFVSRWQEPTP